MKTEKDVFIKKTIDFVKDKLQGSESGHDWWHIHRVWKIAIDIAQHEKANLFVIQLAALLHDIADWKFYEGDETVGSKVAGEFLQSLDVDKHTVSHVCEIILKVSFKGAKTSVASMNSKEGMIVQDADRLDAIGAIGIARAFSYSGHKKFPLYEPGVEPELHKTFDSYKKNTSPTINHFYEKLFLLKDLMNTETGKKLAQERHDFMQVYLKQFFNEWYGKELNISPQVYVKTTPKQT